MTRSIGAQRGGTGFLNLEEYAGQFELEERYWWFVGRRRIVASLLQTLSPPGRDPLRIADVGCGTGGNLGLLDRWGEVTGVDSSPEALRFCSQRGRTNVVRGSADRLPFAEASLDLVTALDVLEHLQDDRAALAEFRRVLRPGGHLVLTVPAYRFIWSEHDEALHHKRRYVLGEVRQKVAGSGLEVRRISYAISAILPVAIVFRILQGLRPSREDRPKTGYVALPGFANALLASYLGLEARWLARASLPAGLSIVCVARR
jgi:SAM-dependent methyltransferase